ncbi:MAG: nitroreductase [Betaproteobacteria bacterium]|nr:nitroreductase [Betaproteobacteria bacterium]
MTLEQLLNDRFSCRAYRPEEVSRETQRRAFAAAQRTPSWCNTQPWQVHVVSGDARDRICRELHGLAAGGQPGNPDFAFPGSYAGVYKDRRKVCGVQLYESLGIGRDDRDRAHAQALENFRGFGAPHVAFITTEQALGIYGMLDCGLYVMSLMLALQAESVQCIAQAALASYPDAVRRFFGLPDSRRVVCGLSFGLADHSAPINGYRTERVAIDDAVHWID